MRAATSIILPSLLACASIAEAGNVTVQVKDQSLRVSADEPCIVRLEQVGLPNTSIRVIPFSNGTVTTTINGSATPLEFSGIEKDVRLDFDDNVNLEIRHVAVQRDLRIDLEHLTELEIRDVQVERDLKISCEDDGLFALIQECEIRDDLTIDVDDGRSVVTLRDTSIADDTRIDLGKPQDSSPNVVTLDGGSFGDKLTIEGSSSGGDIVASGGDAPDVFGKFDVKLGDGDNSFELFGAGIVGKISYRGGKHEDFVSLVNSTFSANVSVDLRDGTNTTSINQAIFGFDLTVKGDDDFDTVGLNGVEVGDDLTIDVDDDDDMIQLTNVKVIDELRIDTGKDDDTLMQNNVVVLGDTDID